jgi:diguanylate cyclase (GGDEF)-like protein
MTVEGGGSGEVSIATRTPTERFVAVSKEGTEASAHAEAPLLRSPPERRRAILLELQGAHPGELFSLQQAVTLIGRSAEADVNVVEATASWRHLRLVVRSGGVHAEDLGSLNGSFVNELRIERPTLLSDGDYLRLGGGATVFKFCMMEEFEERALRGLFSLALRDPLTRLYNASYFAERLLGELALTQREGTTLAVVLVDIDQLKTLNAQRGHQVGDAVLKLVASTLQKLMRPEDILARQADDEFAILIRSTSLRNLQILAERAQSRIASLAIEAGLLGEPLSVSIGIAQFGEHDAQHSVSSMLAAARLAVAAAKRQSTSRIATAPSTPPGSLAPEPA